MDNIVKTNVGVVRSENQDRANVFFNGKYTLAILCDGMGGHEGGTYAAVITIDTFEKEFRKNLPKSENDFGNWFTKALSRSRKNMTKFAGKNNDLLDMGTTVTAAIIGPTKVNIYNVGDSRTYVYNGILHQITKDHNLRNHYIDKLGYTEEEAATVLGAAALTSALGPQKKVVAEQFMIDKTDIEFVILTSDGIHDYIAKPNFENIISSPRTLEEKANVIIKQAIKGKSSDNLTIVIVGVN